MTKKQYYPDGLGALPCNVGPDGTLFFWANEAFHDAALMRSQTDFAHPQITPPQTLLKQARQRFIYRLPADKGAVVVKLFPLSFIGSKLRHPKYAYREFCNTLQARERGVSVPAPMCFIEKRRMGLVTCSGIVQQCLDSCVDLGALYRAGDLSYAEVAQHAAPVLVEMFQRGVNHIDLRDENMMLDQKTGALSVIDWQYANFTTPQAPWLLEYLSAFFIVKAPEQYREELATDWLPSVAETAGLAATELGAFTTRTRALLRGRAKVKQRLSLRAVAS